MPARKAVRARGDGPSGRLEGRCPVRMEIGEATKLPTQRRRPAQDRHQLLNACSQPPDPAAIRGVHLEVQAQERNVDPCPLQVEPHQIPGGARRMQEDDLLVRRRGGRQALHQIVRPAQGAEQILAEGSAHVRAHLGLGARYVLEPDSPRASLW